MDSYFDIKALPNPEIIRSVVVSHLMQELHKLLPEFQGLVGVDFPAYGQQQTLGGIVRLLGNAESIQQLHIKVNNSSVFSDYALITEYTAIPENINGHVECKRKHVKGNSNFRRLQNRKKLTGTWTHDIATAAKGKYSIGSRLPHVCLSSAGTGQQKFMLFIQQRKHAESQNGKFNGYGLSIGGATVPRF